MEPNPSALSLRTHQAPVIATLFMSRVGGAEGDRTPDLRIANATLSQLSYGPMASVAPLRGAAGLWSSCCSVSSKAPERAPSPPCCGPSRLTVRSACRSPLGFPPDVRLPEPRQHADLDLHMAADRPGGAELARRFRHRQPVQPRRRDDRGFPVACNRAAVAADPARTP